MTREHPIIETFVELATPASGIQTLAVDPRMVSIHAIPGGDER
jgi:hypothetical protein